MRIVQFGEGVFLRAFAGEIFHNLVQQGLADIHLTLVQPRRGHTVADLMSHGGCWTVMRRGYSCGRRMSQDTMIRLVDQGISTHEDPQAYGQLAVDPQVSVVISNTTEAGLTWHEADGRCGVDNLPELASYPAKLTWFLYRRWEAGIRLPLHVLPVELISDNGECLHALVVRMAQAWSLDTAFYEWLESYVFFHNTLVDQIVVGHRGEQVSIDGRDDSYSVMCEWYRSWKIDGDRSLLSIIPLESIDPRCGTVAMVEDLGSSRDTKVRILNGLHTVMAVTGIEAGLRTVREALDHQELGAWLRDDVAEEILHTVTDPDGRQFLSDVWDRFNNPFIEHQLSDIALNTSSKIPVRLGPTVVDRDRAGLRSPALAKAVAMWLSAVRDGRQGRDNAELIDLIRHTLHHDLSAEALASPLYRVGRALAYVGQPHGLVWPATFVEDVTAQLI